MKQKKFKRITINRNVILVALIMLVVTAGIINWVNNDSTVPATAPIEMLAEESELYAEAPEEEVAQTTIPENTINKIKEENYNAREDALSLYEDSGSTEEIATLTKHSTQEAMIEMALKAKGFEQVAVLIDDNDVRVVVGKKGLLSSEVAQIKDIVSTKTGYDASRIKISEV